MRITKRVIALILIVAFLCGAAQSDAGVASADSLKGVDPVVRVCLKRLDIRDAVDMILDGTYQVTTDTGLSMLFPRGSEVAVRLRDGNFYLFYQGMSIRVGTGMSFIQTGTGDLSHEGIRFIEGGNLYPGTLSLTIADGVIIPILTIQVQDYLLGVVPYEMSNSFPLEALKAQAICARTYALSHINGTTSYDLVDTTNDQVFRGIYFGNDRVIEAVTSTAGIVGTYKGKLATCYYAASNGGQTELPQNVWATRDALPYYAEQSDPYDVENPESVVRKGVINRNAHDLPQEFIALLWSAAVPQLVRQGYDTTDTSTFRVVEIIDVHTENHAHGVNNNYVSDLTVTFRWAGRKWIEPSSSDEEDYDLAQLFGDRTPAPTNEPDDDQPYLSEFITAREAVTVTIPIFPDVIRIFSLNVSGTTNQQITVEQDDRSFILCARRFGHGVGMSQRGAQWMAEHYGMTCQQIMAFYYPGMDLSQVTYAERITVTPQPQLAATPGPAATATPRPTLMPVSQNLEGACIASVEGIDDDSSLNLRSQPFTGDNVIMRLYKHQQLVVLEISEDRMWAHVRTDVVEGYVMTSYLEFADIPQASSTPSVLIPSE